MADIFVSYKREDLDHVRPLVRILEAEGWTVWWDTRINAGEIWDEIIEREIKAARCVVVVWSQRSVNSQYVRLEAHEGRKRDILVPIIIENVQPPLAFGLIQATNLTEWKGSGDALEIIQLKASIQLKANLRATKSEKGLNQLEQVVAELLEPVIRTWLEKNLPTLVGTSVDQIVASKFRDFINNELPAAVLRIVRDELGR